MIFFPKIFRLARRDHDLQALFADQENVELLTKRRVLDQHHPWRDASLRFLERLGIDRHELLPVRIRRLDLFDDTPELTLSRGDYCLEIFYLALVTLGFRFGFFGSQLGRSGIKLSVSNPAARSNKACMVLSPLFMLERRSDSCSFFDLARFR